MNKMMTNQMMKRGTMLWGKNKWGPMIMVFGEKTVSGDMANVLAINSHLLLL